MAETEKCLRDVWVETSWGSMHCLVSKGNFDPGATVYVLVHGLLTAGDYMLPTATRLARRDLVVVPDLLGHGESADPPRTLSIEEHAQSIVQAMEFFGVKRPVLVGGSYGCNVTIELAVKEDVRAQALILIGPADGSEGSAPTMMGRLLADSIIEPRRMVSMVFSDVSRIGLARVFEQLGHMMQHDFHGSMKSVRIPTLLIVGENDPLVTDDFVCAALGCAPSCERITVPSAAHALPFSRPELMSSLITQFIENRELDRAC